MEQHRKRLNDMRAQAKLGGGEKRIAAQHAKGKLTARERIDLLMDPGSFEELGMLVKHRSTNFGLEKQQFFGGRCGHGVWSGQWPIGLRVFARLYGSWRFLG